MILARAMRYAILPLAACAMAAAVPAGAQQFSEGYRFLEAVGKKDIAKVQEMLGKPGTTVINSKDVTTLETALHRVTKKRDLAWMNMLIGAGADVNARDREGVTPLVIASNLGFIEGVNLLVARQARVDEGNDTGETPLIFAVHRRHIDLMRILLRAGADPDRRDNSGRSARDYARIDPRAAQLLAEIEANAKPKNGPQPAGRVYGPSL